MYPLEGRVLPERKVLPVDVSGMFAGLLVEVWRRARMGPEKAPSYLGRGR